MIVIGWGCHILINFKYMNLSILQATEALKKMYMEFPQLYNNSVVCSFLPEVIYKVIFRIFLIILGELV